jgi:uncharacterized phiE125 gp8 family phage protein
MSFLCRYGTNDYQRRTHFTYKVIVPPATYPLNLEQVKSYLRNTTTLAPVPVLSITRSGATATVTTTVPHGFVTGQRITHSGADQDEYNITAAITYLTETTYTYPVVGTPASPATGTIIAEAVIDDALIISVFIPGVTNFAEMYTKRDFINRTYRTFRDNFCNATIELRRSALQSVDSVKYFKDNALTTVDASTYYSTFEHDFSTLQPVHGASWPGDVDCRLQAIQIEFLAGYGASADDVPADLKFAMLQHIADLYFNRGECCDDCSKPPPEARLIYDIYRIRDILV